MMTIFRRIVLAALAAFSLANMATAKDVEIQKFSVTPTKLPEKFDILGIHTGMNISQVREILEGKTWTERLKKHTGTFAVQKEYERVIANIHCLGKDCVTFNGERDYEHIYYWEIKGEIITVKVTTPPAGSLVYSIERRLDDREMAIPGINDMLERAYTKYGAKAQVKAKDSGAGSACWAITDGLVLEPNPKISMCESNIYAKDRGYPDAYLAMVRRQGFLMYELMDRQLLISANRPFRD